MVLVFDMDDTLYDEATYVDSGFRAVARHLAPTLAISSSRLHAEMMSLLEEMGRGRVFDDLLERYGRYSRHLVNECVSCYRRHEPAIRLHRAGRGCLRRFRHVPRYVVTDGNKTAQAAKVQALDLESKVKRVFITHRYGIRHAKPSPFCFQLIQNIERVDAEQVIYIGDNPMKDFVGIKPLGFRTVRVLTGPHAAVTVRPEFDAEVHVESLDELTPKLLTRLA